MRVAMIQMQTVRDAAKNMKQAERFAEQAAENGADMVVLPEMFCCPYETAVFPDYAQKDGGERWRQISAWANENGIYLAAGSVPECDDAGRIYNTAYVFDRTGSQIAKHRKVHLFDIDIAGGQRFRESDVLSPGKHATVFESEFGKIGLMICYDIRFPEFSLDMAEQGAKMILVPASFNWTTGPAHWELLFRARAMDNQVFMIGVAAAKDENASYQSYGHSIAASPWGEVLHQMDAEEGMHIVEIDLAQTQQLARQMPFMEHRQKRASRQ